MTSKKFTLSLLDWNFIFKGEQKVEYLLVEPSPTAQRRRGSVYLNIPSEPMRNGDDAGAHRPHVSRWRHGRKEHLGFDQETMALVRVPAGSAAWQGMLKLRRADFERMASLLERFVRDVLLKGLTQGSAEDVLADIAYVLLPPVGWMRRFIEEACEISESKVSFLPDPSVLENLLQEVAVQDCVHRVDDAIAIVREMHDALGIPMVLCGGYRNVPGQDVDLVDSPDVRLMHHRLPDGSELWQAVPFANMDREAILEFWRPHCGPRFVRFICSIMDACGIPYERDDFADLGAASLSRGST